MNERMNLYKLTAAFFLLLPLCLSGFANGASFDCGKAGTGVEKMICADAELSELDEDMAAVYRTALQNEEEADSIRNEQKQWLKKRNGCTDAACVKQAYESRIDALASVVAAPLPSEEDAPTKDSDTPSPAKKQLYGFCDDIKGARDCGLQSGKGYTVCEAYLKYLNSLPDTPKCEVPVPPGFTLPEWEELDFLEHLDWAYQIAREKFVGTYKMSFEDWKPLFLKDVAEGRISPQMRKTTIQPIGGKPVGLLAFTEDRFGCTRPYDKSYKHYAVWDGVGYLYQVLTGDPDIPLRTIGSVSKTTETVLLIYGGNCYFVKTYEPYSSPFETEISIVAFSDSPFLIIPEKFKYTTMQRCSYAPLNMYKPKK